ncbi:MAG: ISNCY family transposase [Pirellulaceae bacterium]|nr:ISNCY family transposase [Pirellulaceae bacterium]
MRRPISEQKRFDTTPIDEVKLNLDCRDEIIPVLRGLQQIYSDPILRNKILDLVAEDVNRGSRKDLGREGMGYWQILVLSSVRLGCNFDYDKLQDLAEQHRKLRQIMGFGDWDKEETISWKRIRDNVCLLTPEIIEKISHLVVEAGHQLVPDAAEKVRADSFVAETNIHYPTGSTLIQDGLRKVLSLSVDLAIPFEIPGWRQEQHLQKMIKKIVRNIGRAARSKKQVSKEKVEKLYRDLLKRAQGILERADELVQTLENECVLELADRGQLDALKGFMSRTRIVCDTAYRRVILGEKVSNSEKLFSIFEPHTQLYQRGKASSPIQFGRLVLVFEDSAGFVLHHHVLPRDSQDQDVAVEQTRIAQKRVDGKIKELSFDCGFHSPENQEDLQSIIEHPCLPKKGSKQSMEQMDNASVRFRQARKRHAGVESAIGAMQSGNGLKRSRDRQLIGFERYVALGILGRNIHTLGKIVIQQEDDSCEAACSYREAA